MTPQLEGTLETLQMDLAGRQLRLVLESRGPQGAPLWLLLPALSTVSSRGEWTALAEAVGDQRQLVSFDWPGFGDSERAALRINGFAFAHLGDRILRVEAAALVGGALMLAQLRVWEKHHPLGS
jgi:pimeloyl-ACP methyl ester carboxylesterase